MNLSASAPPKSNPSAGRDLREWQTRILNGILSGTLALWMLALVSGINNVVKEYRRDAGAWENPLAVAVAVIAVYALMTGALAFVTFARTLPYNVRAAVLLVNLYLLGAIGLFLASLSGDGRIFLFAFVILAAVLLESRISVAALAVAVVTLVVVGWSQVTRVIVVPVELQINSTNVNAWLSGTLVFVVLSIAGLISVAYLLRALGQSVSVSRGMAEREQRLGQILRTIGGVSQLIVREHDQARMLAQVCERLVAGRDYAFVWIGLLQADGVTLSLAASAGEAVDPAQFTVRLDEDGSGPACAALALRSRKYFRVEASPDGDTCMACPRRILHPTRTALALPLLRDGGAFGVLVADHTRPFAVFDDQETQLLQELADDLAYALENLRANEQRRVLAESASALLSVRDAASLWPVITKAVGQALRADRVGIYLLDRAADRLWCPYSSGLSDGYVAEVNRRFREVPGSRILTSPEPVIVGDVRTDSSVAPFREWMLREGFRSYAVFPFSTSMGLIGTFVAYRDVVGSFSASDLMGGQTLVRMVGMAWENVRLQDEAVARTNELARAYDDTLAGWARALELRDEPTEGHTRRVTDLTLRLARSLGISEAELVHIRRGALLHDIGKMGIPDSILRKSGPLNAEETAVMNRHPQYAFEMLSGIAFVRSALDIPYCHHEHWDGTGYPRGLRGEAIPLAARIFAVVDVWDALTSDRPYRKAWSKEEAISYIKENAGQYFDPQIVHAFLAMNIDQAC